MADCDLSVVISGVGAGPYLTQAIRAARLALSRAAHEGLAGELLVALDEHDRVAAAVAAQEIGPGERVASARGPRGVLLNTAVAQGRGRLACVFDGRDMIAPDWLVEAHARLSDDGFGGMALHPAATIVFGDERRILRHARSGRTERLLLPTRSYFAPQVTASAELFRRAGFREAEIFDESWLHRLWAADAARAGGRHHVLERTAFFTRSTADRRAPV